jgi:hypothetical protein
LSFSIEVRRIERLLELVKLDLVRVELRRVDPRVSEERTKRPDVAAALAEEASP